MRRSVRATTEEVREGIERVLVPSYHPVHDVLGCLRWIADLARLEWKIPLATWIIEKGREFIKAFVQMLLRLLVRLLL